VAPARRGNWRAAPSALADRRIAQQMPDRLGELTDRSFGAGAQATPQRHARPALASGAVRFFETRGGLRRVAPTGERLRGDAATGEVHRRPRSRERRGEICARRGGYGAPQPRAHRRSADLNRPICADAAAPAGFATCGGPGAQGPANKGSHICAER